MEYPDGFVATFHEKVSVTLFEKYVETCYFFFSKDLTKQESQKKIAVLEKHLPMKNGNS